jgi:multidrug efflux system outer membrane protein
MIGRRKIAGVCVAGALLAGCAVSPDPIPQAEHIRRSLEDRAQMFARQEPIVGVVTLEQALARALLHNLDQRLSMFEQAMQLRQLDVANLEMLPRLTANAGYKVRDREEVKWSKDYYTGIRGTNPSVGEDEQLGTADLTLQWSVLDFGVSYVQALQQADRALVARERRRRTVNNMFQEVRTAYWQAAAAQRVRGDLRPVLTDALFALETLRDIERRRAQPLAANLRAQRQILDLIRQLEGLEIELQTATARLAQLMGLPANANFDVAVVEPAAMSTGDVPYDIDTLERIALVSRPEVREEAYNVRIAHNEARRGMLRLLPNLNFLAQNQYNDNSYIHTRTWNEASARVTFNLFSLVSLPEQRRLGDAQRQVAELRRQAVSMAVVTQVNLALRTYARAVNTFQRASEIAEIEKRLAELGAQQQQAQAVADLDRIRGRAEAIVAELERDRAFASLQNALASVYASLGVDLLPETLEATDLASLTRAIETANRGLLTGRLNLAGKPIDDLAQEIKQIAGAPEAPEPEPRPEQIVPVARIEAAPAPAAAAPDGVRRTRWWFLDVEIGGQPGGGDNR